MTAPPTPLPLAVVEENLRQMMLDPLPPHVGSTVTRASAASQPSLSWNDEQIALYRRLVRGNLARAILMALPIARARLGDTFFEARITEFLAQEPPRTRVLREVPLTFAGWMARRMDTNWPAPLPELVHFECIEIEVTHAPEFHPEPTPPPLPHADATPLAHPSARLLAYRHPVHHMRADDAGWPEATHTPVFLVAFRKDEAMRVIEVPATVAKVLMRCETDASLGLALTALQTEHGGDVREAEVFDWLTRLTAAGALLGFPRRSIR